MFGHLTTERQHELFVQMLQEIIKCGGRLTVQHYKNRKGRNYMATFLLSRPTRWGSMRVLGEYGKNTLEPLEALRDAWIDRFEEAPTLMEDIEAGYVHQPTGSRNGW